MSEVKSNLESMLKEDGGFREKVRGNFRNLNTGFKIALYTPLILLTLTVAKEARADWMYVKEGNKWKVVEYHTPIKPAMQVNVVPIHSEKSIADAVRKSLGDVSTLSKEELKKKLNYEFVIMYKRGLAENPKNAGSHFELGLAYLGFGMYDEAARSIEEAMDLEPENKEYVKGLADVYYLEGLEFYNKKEYDAAERPLEESTKLDGGRAEPHYYLSVIFFKKKEYDKAN